VTAEVDAEHGENGYLRRLIEDDLAASLAIAGVVAMSLTLVRPAPAGLAPGFLVLIVLLAAGCWPLRRGLRLAWRLKWFLVSLLVFFGWLSPETDAAGWERAMPSPEGLGDAGLRVAALLLVVFWVAWLTSTFDRHALVQGLSRWLMLLRPVGFRGGVFARRLFLALELFETQETDYRAFRQRVGGSRWSRVKAGREFLIERLDRALTGDATPPREAGGTVPRPSGGRNAGVLWQVSLLWLAVLGTIWLRATLPMGGA
jgi:hypothetical protein